MRFGILTQYYPPEIGAPQARLSELAQGLTKRGHEVAVLTAMPNYPAGRVFEGYSGLWRQETLAGIPVVRTPIYPSKALGVKRLASYGSFVLSSALLGPSLLPKLDFVMTESPPLFLGISGFLLSRLKRARWIFNVSDLWPESAVRLGVVRPGFSLRMAGGLESFCYRRAWLVSGQSKEILSNIEARFPGVDTWHLSNGVNPQLFSPAAASSEARSRLGGGECIAVYAGLHGIAQGLDQILATAARLRQVSGLRFVFVGDGPEKTALQRRAAELGLNNVRFLDPVERSAMPGLLASADLAIVPLVSYIPGAVPSKIYEAMASAVPIVFIGQGEGVEIIDRSGAGIAVPPGQPELIAAAIRHLIDNPAERSRRGAAGRRAAETLFNRHAIVDGFIDHLEASLIPETRRKVSTTAAVYSNRS